MQLKLFLLLAFMLTKLQTSKTGFRTKTHFSARTSSHSKMRSHNRMRMKSHTRSRSRHGQKSLIAGDEASSANTFSFKATSDLRKASSEASSKTKDSTDPSQL